jgi:hypothetical protein
MGMIYERYCATMGREKMVVIAVGPAKTSRVKMNAILVTTQTALTGVPVNLFIR